MAPGRGRGGLEREVLAVLAAADGPLTAGDVLAQLDGHLAYTTVMTTLSRLHAKHALTREVSGRAYQYALAGGAAGSQANVTAHRMLRLLETGDDRAGVLTRFVADLTPQDEHLLAELLAGDELRDELSDDASGGIHAVGGSQGTSGA